VNLLIEPASIAGINEQSEYITISYAHS